MAALARPTSRSTAPMALDCSPDSSISGVEIAIIGYSNEPPHQPFYLLLGAAITAVGLAWVAHRGRSATNEAVAIR